MKREEVKMDGVKNAFKQTAITEKEGWQGWAMRIFTLGEEGHTPRHTHEWPHINYIVKGKGTLFMDGEEKVVQAGDAAYVPAGELHQFRNAGKEDFAFMCIVPEEGDK